MSLTLRFPDAPRAPHFIVTLYGDVVEPRGGSLWMGTLIDRCARHGISESLVRTAVSRLVTAGHLDGVRLGRRSYYRLSDRAEAEFRAAARVLFDPAPLSMSSGGSCPPQAGTAGSRPSGCHTGTAPVAARPRPGIRRRRAPPCWAADQPQKYCA